MQKGIHPETFKLEVSCVCGNRFETISTSEEIRTDVCSNCHPIYTGTQKFVDTAGRIEKFEQRYNKGRK